MEQNFQKIKKRQLFAIILVAFLTFLAIFYMFKARNLNKALQQETKREAAILQAMEEYKALQRIDSILVQGEYNTALEAYNQAKSNKDLEDVAGVQLRIELAEQLVKLDRGDHPTQLERALRDSLDSIRLRNSIVPKEIQQFDSLSFALEKAKVQLTNMRRQLQNKSFGEYLQFTNPKGSQMHYVGQVLNNKANGYGVALLNTGSRYEGEFKDNLRHGEGSFYWPDGEYYVGTYVNDRRNGLGTYYWPNGEKYVGQWKDDKRNGKGIFYGKDGAVIAEGIWKNDKLKSDDQKQNRKR